MADNLIAHGSKEAFLQFAKQGFPRPHFAAEERLRKVLKREYAKLIQELLADFMRHAKNAGIAPEALTQDDDGNEDNALERLSAFFDQMAAEERKAKEAQEKANLKAFLENARINCEREWQEKRGQETEADNTIQTTIFDILLESQKNFTKKLGANSNSVMQFIVGSFSVDKQKLYNDNMENLRALYLDNTMRRIEGEKDLLKRKILEKISGYVTGKSDTLDIKDLTEKMLTSSARMARFFARDQLGRLNKATTISTLISAGVTKVRWLTSNDRRVRESHKKLNRNVYDIHNLPDEIDDYNCRCTLVPLEYAD